MRGLYETSLMDGPFTNAHQVGFPTNENENKVIITQERGSPIWGGAF